MHRVCVSHSVVSDSLQPPGLQPTRLLCPWHSPGKNTEVGCHSLLQGIFLTQGLNLALPHYRQMLYHLSHRESPYQERTAVCQPFDNIARRQSSTSQEDSVHKTTSARTLILGFPESKTVKTKLLLFKPVYGLLLQRLEQTKTACLWCPVPALA